jgi:hypothetical protein
VPQGRIILEEVADLMLHVPVIFWLSNKVHHQFRTGHPEIVINIWETVVCRDPENADKILVFRLAPIVVGIATIEKEKCVISAEGLWTL